MLSKYEMSSKIDVFEVPSEQLNEAEISDLANEGIAGLGYCGGGDMAKSAARGWMWQELVFGSIPEKIDNAVGYLVYCAVISGGFKLPPACETFKMRDMSVLELVRSV